MPRILLVDDEPDLVWAIRYSLCDAGYAVMTAQDGEAGLEMARLHHPDLIILDIVMPKLDGIQICWYLRRDPSTAAIPILFLSMRNAIEDRVACLEQGGDDYLAKPFDLRELKARIAALLRRGSGGATPQPTAQNASAWLAVGPLALNLHTYQVRVADKAIHLTPAEFKLLHYLMQYPDRIFSSQHLLQEVWGYSRESADPGIVRWHIKKLRAKVEPNPDQPRYIRTVPRHGFGLFEPSATRAAGGAHQGIQR
jgi:DNA-binding response OmpR family regulator